MNTRDDRPQATDPNAPDALSPRQEAITEALRPDGSADEAWLDALDAEGLDELEGFMEVTRALRQDRAQADPGEHFFEALAQDIMGKLDEPEPAPRVLQGQAVEPVVSGQQGGGLWAWASALFGGRPTLAWGGVMAAALVAVVLWPRDNPPRVDGPDAGTAPLANRAVEGSLADRLPLETSLPAEELAELEALAARISLPDPSSVDDGELWASEGIGGGWDAADALDGLDDDQLEALEEALARPL